MKSVLGLLLMSVTATAAQADFSCDKKSIKVSVSGGKTIVSIFSPGSYFPAAQLDVIRENLSGEELGGSGIKEIRFVFNSSSCEHNDKDERIVFCQARGGWLTVNQDEYVEVENYRGDKMRLQFSLAKNKDAQGITFSNYYTETTSVFGTQKGYVAKGNVGIGYVTKAYGKGYPRPNGYLWNLNTIESNYHSECRFD